MNCSDFMTSKSNSRIKRKIIESLALREREKKDFLQASSMKSAIL